MNRWGALKLLARLLGYMALVVGGWGFFVWAAFLIRFEFGLVMAGISLLAIAWAVNKSVEDKFTRAAEMYADTVFEGTTTGLRVLDSALEPAEIQRMAETVDLRAGMALADGDALGLDATGDVIRHETTDNGDGGDDMEIQEVVVHPDVVDEGEGFQFVKDEPVLDDVDQKIDRLLRGGNA